MTEGAAVPDYDWVAGLPQRLDGIGHWVPVHVPDQLNRLLLEFLGIS